MATGSRRGMGDAPERFHEGKRVPTGKVHVFCSFGSFTKSHLRKGLPETSSVLTQTLHFNCLYENGAQVNQSVPIVLAVSTSDKERYSDSDTLVLRHRGKELAVLRKPEFYYHRKEERCCRQFGTCDPRHPCVKMILESGDWLVGGDLEVLEKIRWNDGLDRYRLTPNEIRAKCREMGADAVFAFQLRNPIHNGHALLMQVRRCSCFTTHFTTLARISEKYSTNISGHQKTPPRRARLQKAGAAPSSSRRVDQGRRCSVAGQDTAARSRSRGRCPARGHYSRYLPWSYVLRRAYGGNTQLRSSCENKRNIRPIYQVQWHAKSRMNAGANFYIVGRDPAGVPHPDRSATPDGNLYDGAHGAHVLSMAPGLRNVEILPFKVAAYDTRTKSMSFLEAERRQDFVFISGTKMRGKCLPHFHRGNFIIF